MGLILKLIKNYYKKKDKRIKNLVILLNNKGKYYNTNNINFPCSLSNLVNLNSILIGIMLGDGSLYRSSPTANVRFEMSLGPKYK